MLRGLGAVAVLLAIIWISACSDGPSNFDGDAGDSGDAEVYIEDINFCPHIDILEAAPLDVMVGGKIDLHAEVHDPDDEWLYLWWSAKSGFVAEPSSLETTYTCRKPGKFTIRFSAVDSKKCVARESIPIQCLEK